MTLLIPLLDKAAHIFINVFSGWLGDRGKTIRSKEKQIQKVKVKTIRSEGKQIQKVNLKGLF